MKREGISTLFIHGYPWALSYLVLDHLPLIFNCLKLWCVCVCFWKCFWKRCLVLGNHCDDSCLSVLQRCVSFRKDVSNVFESLFWKCFGERCLVLGQPCNNSLLECFTKVHIFSKRCFKSLNSWFLKVLWIVVFEKKASVFARLISSN